jgi:hypothetical protein
MERYHNAPWDKHVRRNNFPRLDFNGMSLREIRDKLRGRNDERTPDATNGFGDCERGRVE